MVGSTGLSLSTNNNLFRNLDEGSQLIAQRYGGNYYDDSEESYGYTEGDFDYASRSQIRERRTRPARRGAGGRGGAANGWLTMLQNQRQLGAMLLGGGILLTFMGMMLFFEGNLLRLGNLCMIAGVFLLIGPKNVSGFFLKESRMQATVITSIGILMVFWGKPRLGLLVEIFGLLNLFGNMFPVLLAVGKKMPIIGDVLSIFDGKDAVAGRGARAQRYPRPGGAAGAARRQEYDQYGDYGGHEQYGGQHSYDPDF